MEKKARLEPYQENISALHRTSFSYHAGLSPEVAVSDSGTSARDGGGPPHKKRKRGTHNRAGKREAKLAAAETAKEEEKIEPNVPE